MQPVLALMMVAAMFFFGVCWALKWLDLAPDYLILAGMVSLALTTGVYLIGGALVPGWERGYWRIPKTGLPSSELRRASVEMGRLVFLGAGIWFITGGVGILAAGILGENGLPRQGLYALFSAFGFALVVFLIGLRLDQRRLDTVREFEDAQRWADLHP